MEVVGGKVGYVTRRLKLKDDAVPVDNITKFAYTDDDYEEVEEFVELDDSALHDIKMKSYDILALDAMKTAIRILVKKSGFSSQQLNDVAAIFDEWVSGRSYVKDDIVRYGGKLYKAFDTSKSDDSNKPDISTVLWKLIADSTSQNEVNEWKQPIGATDTYNVGDSVTYHGKTWTSIIDNNVWAPGHVGWREKVDEESNSVAGWVRPSGAHDVYNEGDVVLYNGRRYRSKMNANAWAPDVYGWDQV